MTSSALMMSSAGHLPPITVDPGGPARPLRLPADMPLGAYRRAPRRVTRPVLPPEGGLFLYTDGLVEQRDRPFSAGIAALAEALEPASADAMCASAMARMLAERVASDDIALLAVRYTAAP